MQPLVLLNLVKFYDSERNVNMSFHRLLPVLLVAFFVVACTPAPDLRNESFLDDTSLISGDPCEAPCWQNLIPGETVWGVAQDTLAGNDDYVELDTDSNRRTGEAWIEFAFRDGLKCCRIHTVDGETLSSILLLLSPQLTVSDVIDSFGEPIYMTAQAETPDQSYVTLVYPETNMVVYAFAENITDSQITADNEVIGVVYMSAPEMENLLQTENLYNWEGFTVLANVIDGVFDSTPIPPTEEANG